MAPNKAPGFILLRQPCANIEVISVNLAQGACLCQLDGERVTVPIVDIAVDRPCDWSLLPQRIFQEGTNGYPPLFDLADKKPLDTLASYQKLALEKSGSRRIIAQVLAQLKAVRVDEVFLDKLASQIDNEAFVAIMQCKQRLQTPILSLKGTDTIWHGCYAAEIQPVKQEDCHSVLQYFRYKQPQNIMQVQRMAQNMHMRRSFLFSSTYMQQELHYKKFLEVCYQAMLGTHAMEELIMCLRYQINTFISGKKVKSVDYEVYHSKLTDLYNSTIIPAVEGIFSDNANIIDRVYAIVLQIQPFYLILITLGTYLQLLGEQQKKRSYRALPSIQKLFLCFSRFCQSKIQQACDWAALFPQISQHIRTCMIQRSHVKGIVPRLVGSEVQLDGLAEIQRGFDEQYHTLVQYILGALQCVYACFPTSYDLDDNGVTIKAFGPVYAVHNFYLANCAEARGSDLESAGQSPRRSTPRSGIIFPKCDIEQLYDENRRQQPGGLEQLSYFAMHITDTDAIQQCLDSNRVYVFVNTLCQEILARQSGVVFADWQINDPGVVRMSKISAQTASHTKFRTHDDLDHLLLCHLDTIECAIDAIGLQNQRERLNACRDILIFINSLQDEVQFNFVKLNLLRLKEDAKLMYERSQEELCSRILQEVTQLLKNSVQQVHEFVSQAINGISDPETLSYLLLVVEKLPRNNTYHGLVCVMHKIICLQQDLAGFVSMPDVQSQEPINHVYETIRLLRLFYKHVSVSEIHEQASVYAQMIAQVDIWLYDHVFELGQRIQEFLQIKEDDIQLTQCEALQFQEKYKLTCKNVDVKAIQVPEKLLGSHFCGYFIMQLQKFVSLQLKSKATNARNWPLVFTKRPAVDKATPVDACAGIYLRDKITFKNNKIDVKKVLGELLYLAQQYTIIQKVINTWRGSLFQITQAEDMDPLKQPLYPGPNYLLNVIRPVYAVVIASKQLFDIQQQDMERHITDIRLSLQNNHVNILIDGYSDFDKYCHISYHVFNSRYDYMDFRDGQMQHVSFICDLKNWRWCYAQTIDQLRRSIYNLCVLKVMNKICAKMSDEKFMAYFIHLAEAMLGLENPVSCSAASIVEHIRSGDMLEVLLFISRIYDINKEAINVIDVISKALEAYQIKQQFQMAGDAPGVQLQQYTVSQLIIYPFDMQDFVNSSLCQLGLVFNNGGFVERYRVHTTDILDSMLEFVQQTDIKVREQRTLDHYYNYINLLQERARKLEAELTNSLHIYQIIRRVPYLIIELLRLVRDGYLIVGSEQSGEKQSKFMVDLLSDEERRQIHELSREWAGVVEYNFQAGQKLSTVAMKPKILSQMSRLCYRADRLYNRVCANKQRIVISQLTSFYNKAKNTVESTFNQTISYETSYSMVVSTAHKRLVPYYYGVQCTHAPTLPDNPSLYFSSFHNSGSIVKHTSSLRNEYLYNIDDFIFEQQNVIGLASGGEQLLYDTPVLCPQLSFFALNVIEQPVAQAFARCCREASREFALVYEAMRRCPQQIDTLPQQLQAYVRKYPFHVAFVGITTCFMGIFHCLATARSIGGHTIVDASLEKRILGLLKKCTHYDAGDHQYKAYDARAAEMISMLDYVQEQSTIEETRFAREKFKFPLIYYDEQHNGVYTTTNVGGLSLEVGRHWLGQPTIHDGAMQFSIEQLTQVAHGLLSMQERTVTILVGNQEQHYKNQHIRHYIAQLSRYACRRHVFIPIAETTFARNIQELASFLAAGYIVIAVGVEFLPDCQVLELIALANTVYYNKGVIPGLVTYDSSNTRVPKHIAGQSDSLDHIQSTLHVDDAQISNFTNVGHMMLYIPCLYGIKQVEEFTYDADSTSGTHGGRYNLQNGIQVSTPITVLINKFENKQLICFRNACQAECFLRQSRRYGECFYELHCYLAQLNSRWPKLCSNQIPQILNKAKDRESTVCVAMATLDFLLHQHYQPISDGQMQKLPEQLVKMLSACFVLDQSTADTLCRIATEYTLLMSKQLIGMRFQGIPKGHNGIKLQQAAAGATFEQYLLSLQDYISKELLYYIRVLSIAHNLPVQKIYDVFYVNDLLRLGQPVLVAAPCSSYAKAFAATLTGIKSWKLHYATNDLQVAQSVRCISMAQEPRESLIVINPPSILALEQMLDQIIGFFLEVPRVRDPLYAAHYFTSKAPAIIVFLEYKLARPFFRNKKSNLFLNKVLLMPPEYNTVHRHLIMRPLQVRTQHFMRCFIASGGLFKDRPLNDSITSATQYNTALEQMTVTANQRLYALKGLLHCLVGVSMATAIKIFDIQNRTEDYLILRQIFYSFLIRCHITQVEGQSFSTEYAQDAIKSQQLFDCEQKVDIECRQRVSSLGCDAMNRLKVASCSQSTCQARGECKDYYTDMLAVNRTLIADDIFPVPDIGGYCTGDIFHVNKKIRNTMSTAKHVLEEVWHRRIKKAYTPSSDVGTGLCGSMFYQLSFTYLYDNIISAGSAAGAFTNVFQMIFANILNASALYSQVVLKKSIEDVRECCIRMIALLRQKSFKLARDELELFTAAAAILAMEQKLPCTRPYHIDTMTVFSQCDTPQTDHKPGQDNRQELFNQLSQRASLAMPPEDDIVARMKDGGAYYLLHDTAHNKYIVAAYELGQGIFDDLSSLSDRQQIQEAIRTGGGTFQFSLQNISETPVYLDAIRVATAFFLSCAMQTPITTAVTGARSQGKSLLIATARAMSRDIVMHNSIILQDLNSQYSTAAVAGAFTQQFRPRSYTRAQQQRYRHCHIPEMQGEDAVVLDFGYSGQFPSYHFHLSEIDDSGPVDPKFRTLFSDHMVHLSGAMVGYNVNNKFMGCISMSDCSFIVECGSRSQVVDNCHIEVAVPSIDENFLGSYFKLLYPEQTSEWNSSFIQGFFLIKSAIPSAVGENFLLLQRMYENQIYLVNKDCVRQNVDVVQQLDMYNTRRYEGMVLPSTVLMESADDQIVSTNVHSLFYALRSIGTVTSSVIHKVTDRLASLMILGYLRDKVPDTPWFDSELLLTGRYTLYNVWESQILNFSLLVNRPAVEADEKLIQRMLTEQDVLISDRTHSLVDPDTDKRFQQVLQNYVVNPFWFGHIIEITKQIQHAFNPLVLCRSFELFIKLISSQHKQVIKLSALDNLRSIVGRLDYIHSVYSCDCYQQLKLDLTELALKRKKEHSDHLSIDRVITTTTMFSVRVQLYYMNLLNAQTDAYQQMVSNITMFSTYKPIEAGKPIPNNVIFDMHFLSQQMDIDQSDISIGIDKLPFLAQVQRFNRILQQRPNLSKNAMQITLITLLRVAVGLALGVNPLAWFDVPEDNSADSSLSIALGVPLTSKFQSDLLSSAIENGKLLSYMPSDHKPAIQADGCQYVGSFQQYITTPHNVFLIAPKSILELPVAAGVSMLTLLSNTLNSFNCLQTLFLQEELQFLLHCGARLLGLNHQLSARHLSTLLAPRLSVLMVSDDPCGSKITPQLENVVSENIYDCMRLQAVGSIKSPILEFMQSIIHYKDIIQKDTFRMQEHQIRAYDMGDIKMPLKIVDPLITRLIEKMQQSKFNLVSISQQNMLQFYQISGCVLPTEVELPDKIKLDWPKVRYEFAQAAIQMYSYLNEKCRGPCVSLSQFSRTASKIMEHTMLCCQSFFQSINSIFTAYRLYAGIQATDTEPRIFSLSNFNIQFLRQKVTEAQEQILNGKKQFVQDIQLQVATESVYLRDYIHNIILNLQQEFQCYKYAAQNAHFDAICLTAQLYFGVSNLINNDHAFQLLTQEFTTSMDDWFLTQLEQYQSGNEDVCSFNMLMAAILNQAGFKVRLPAIPEGGNSDRNPRYRRNVLAQNAIQYSDFLFLSNFMDTAGCDWPLFPITKMLNLKWEHSDEAGRMLTACAAFCQIGFKTFIIRHDLAIPCAILVESIKANRILPREYYKLSNSIMQESDDKKGSAGSVYITDMLKRFIQVDLNQNPYEFDQTLQKALTCGDQTILFTNYGSGVQWHEVNSITMQKFLRLRATGTVKRKSVVQIGVTSAAINNDLASYYVIIGMAIGTNCIVELGKSGLLTQEFLDQCATCDGYGIQPPVNEQQRLRLDEKAEISFIQYQLLQGCYGDKASKRGLVEGTRFRTKHCSAMINKVGVAMLSFVKQRLLQIDKSISIQALDYNTVSHLVSKYAIPQNAEEVQYQISMLRESNDKLEDDLSGLFALVQELDQALYAKQYMTCGVNQPQIVNSPVSLACQEECFVRTHSKDVCRQIAVQLYKINSNIRKLACVHAPLWYLASDGHLNQLRAFIYARTHQLEGKPPTQSNDNYSNIVAEYGTSEFSHLSGISGLIGVDKHAFVKFVAQSYLEHTNQMAIKLLPPQFQWPFYNYLQCNLLALLQVTHFQYTSTTDQESCGLEEISLMHQTLCFSQKDQLKLLVTAQLASQLHKLSPFSLERQNIGAKDLEHILDGVPEICRLNYNILYLWVQATFAGKYNLIIKDSLLWLLQHNSVMIELSNVKNQLVSMLQYWICSQSPTKKTYVADFKQAIADLDSSYFNVKISRLPPVLENVNEKSIFSALIMSLLLAPEQLDVSFRVYNAAMRQSIGMNFDKIKEGHECSVEASNPAIITGLADAVVDASEMKHTLLQKLHEPVRLLCRMCSLQQFDTKQLTDLMLSEQLLQCYIFMNLLLKNPASNIGIVYYDQSINIQDIMRFVHQLLDTGVDMAIQKQPTRRQMQLQMNLYNIQPNSDGKQLVFQLRQLLEYRLNSNQENTFRPLILTIPSSSVQGYPNISFYGSTSTPPSATETMSFFEELCMLQKIVQINYMYVKQQDNLFDNFKHVFNMYIITNQLMARRFGVSSDNENIMGRQSARGLLLLLLKQAFGMLRSNSSSKDHQFIPIVRRVFDGCFNVLERQQLNIEQDECTKIACADTIFLQDNDEHVIGNSFQRIQSRNLDVDIMKLLFRDDAAAVCLFQKHRAVATSSNIDLKTIVIRQSEEVFPTCMWSMQRPESQASEQSQSGSRHGQNAVSKDLLRFIQRGGRSSNAAVQLMKQKLEYRSLAKEETDIYGQVELCIHDCNVQLSEFERLDATAYERSVQQLLVGVDELMEVQDTKDTITLEKRYVKFEDIVRFFQGLSLFNRTYNATHENCENPIDFLNSAFYHRWLFSSQAFVESFVQLPTEVQANQLPRDIRAFLDHLDTQLPTHRVLKTISHTEILENLIPGAQLVSNHVSLNQYFLRVKGSYIVSVPVFQHVLGNIFYMLELENANRTMTSLSQQRVVITLTPPLDEPRVAKNGEIHSGGNIGQGQGRRCWFYLTLRGFQLVNAHYDDRLGSIADVTPESRRGFMSQFDLYASIAVVDTTPGPLLIPQGFVPVPLQVGGTVRPFVLLPNHSGISDDEWCQRGPFFDTSSI